MSDNEDDAEFNVLEAIQEVYDAENRVPKQEEGDVFLGKTEISVLEEADAGQSLASLPETLLWLEAWQSSAAVDPCVVSRHRIPQSRTTAEARLCQSS